MAIRVTCEKCLTRFNVSDKFAGKKGPCPKCKATIQIPDKSEEVVVHAPVDDGPKDSTGKSVLKPIMREEVRVTKLGIFAVAGSILAAIIAAIVLRSMESVPGWVPPLGALLLAPPLVWSGYTFAREQELEPFYGSELQARVAICSVLFALLWALYAFVPAYVMDYDSVAEMPIGAVLVALAAMLAVGTIISVTTFELETGGGVVHAGFYIIATLLLAMLAGIPLFAWA
ncbi:hypothetical protein Poly24_34930 [Rosistilla carotiformis]|uniref:Uncharacterized protein n=1 Tax=Rosistilla carotiformis TaxID=2528017 RepID=A0A518JW56_9BACT|nr:hypothetical protein [Rosistilla carotiformis]QDV69776.1 hypothetical protein Poly24_34930 [Rosistilla carotiformis]